MFARIKATLSAARLAVKIATSPGFKVTSIADIFGGILNGIDLSQFKDYESYLKAGSKKVWALYKGCDCVAKIVMDTPWIITRQGGDGTEIKAPEIVNLLQRPNDFESWGEMIFKWCFHMKMTGNAFWVKDQPNFNGDRPKRLFQLNPKRVRLVVSKAGAVTGYLYHAADGEVIPFDAAEIIHFRLPHPDNDFWGLGEVEAAEPLFNDFINRNTWTEKFWKNGASPSGVLICEDQIADETKWNEAKKKWQAQYGGSENAGKTAWLTGKWKYEQLGLTAQEMQNIEMAKWNVEQIFMQLGVPLSVAGVQGAANYATASVDDIRFRRYTIKPLIAFLESKLNDKLIMGFNAAYRIDFQLSGLIDMETLGTAIGPLFDRGVLSINEIREMAGLPKKKDNPIFDQHFVTSTYVPLELAGIVDQGQGQAQADQIVKRALADLIKQSERRGTPLLQN